MEELDKVCNKSEAYLVRYLIGHWGHDICHDVTAFIKRKCSHSLVTSSFLPNGENSLLTCLYCSGSNIFDIIVTLHEIKNVLANSGLWDNLLLLLLKDRTCLEEARVTRSNILVTSRLLNVVWNVIFNIVKH